jgi:hypothetical protein
MKEKIIKIDENYIKVKFFKRSRKNFIIRVVGEEIHVSIPKNSTYKNGEQILTKKLKEIKEMMEKNNKNSIFSKKNSIFYLGKSYDFIFEEKIKKPYFEEKTVLAKNKVDLKLWIKSEAEKLIKEEYIKISNLIGIKGEKIKIRPLKSAWGICYSNGNITFNSLLICLPKEIIRYVIIHELCHRVHMNHSKEFWALVDKYFKNHKEARLFLKDFGRGIYSNNPFF